MAIVPDLSGNNPLNANPDSMVPARLYNGGGKSFSANLPSIATTTGAGNILLAEVPVNTYRTVIVIENQSASQVFVYLDRGNETELWLRLLTGVGANQQGAEYVDYKFKGRVRVYGLVGTQVSVGEI